MRIKVLLLFLAVLTNACQPENTLPVAMVYAVPEAGDSTTVFMLEGKNSSDQESSFFVLKYRWDTNADGIWDSGYSTRTSTTARFIGTGYQKYVLEVTDEDGGASIVTDSVFILVRNLNLDTFTDSRNGHPYRMVKIGSNWWMAENLAFGTPIDAKTPFRNNDVIEFLYFNNDKEYDHYGCLYTWDEAHQYPRFSVHRDICPPGWRIPSISQWSDLFKTYAQPFDILYYFGPSSIENLGIEMRGYYQYGDPLEPMNGDYSGDEYRVRYWTSGFTGEDSTRFFTGINFTRDSCYFVKSFNRPAWIYHPQFPAYIIGFETIEAYYVRCIKE